MQNVWADYAKRLEEAARPNRAASAACLAERPGRCLMRPARIVLEGNGRVAPPKTLRSRLCSAGRPLRPYFLGGSVTCTMPRRKASAMAWARSVHPSFGRR